MDRSFYPALAGNPDVIHLDASAAFPIHKNVVKAVEQSMSHIVATPSKANYDWAIEASRQVDEARTVAGELLGVDAENIHFSYSATDGFRALLSAIIGSGKIKSVVYSPEDHDSTVAPLQKLTEQTKYHTSYTQDGKLIFPDGVPKTADALIVVTHIHPLYGCLNSITEIRQEFPNAIIVVDASQSVARAPVEVDAKACDALFFSSQKIGGIAGVGVTYISQELLTEIGQDRLPEPNTISLPAVAGLIEAARIIKQNQPAEIENTLSKMTSYLTQKMQEELPNVKFTKGPAHSYYSCNGYGIVSFSVDGYGSVDVAMILNDSGINARAADHCLSEDFVDRDVVRVSLYTYNTFEEIDQLIKVLSEL